MLIRFQELELSNFLSYGKSPTIIDLDKSPNTVLIGDSGSGKSAIPHAISFCLFDDTLRGIQKAQLVNSENKKSCYVQVKFQIGSDEYAVKRRIKPNKLNIQKNGEDIGVDFKVADLQKHLEQDILKLDKKTFYQVVSLTEVNFTPFMQLPAKDRRAFIEKILGIEIFSIMNTILKTKIKETSFQISELDSQVENLEEKIDIHKSYIKKAKKDNKSKVQEIIKTYKKVQSQKKNLLPSIDELKEKVLESRGLKKQKLLAAQKVTEINNELNSLECDLEDLKLSQERILKDTICIECGQPIPKSSIQEKISKSNNKIESIKKKIKTLEKEFKTADKKFQSYKNVDSELEESESLLFEKVTEFKRLKDRMNLLESEKKKLSSNKTKDIGEIQSKINELRSSIRKSQKELSSLHSKSEIQKICLNMLKDGGIKSEIIRNYVPKINSFMNKYLSEMELDVSFKLNEEFDERIDTRGKESYSYNNFSAGQKQKIDLALLFTWRSIAKSLNSVNTNLLFLDEVVDSHLNSEATEPLIDMFQGDLFKGTNVFVISHKREIANKFHKVINLKLENGFTQISYGAS